MKIKIQNFCLERFQLSIPFTDSDGLLTLSSDQKKKFVQWIRPDQLCSDPKMVVGDSIDFYSIKQTVIIRKRIYYIMNCKC